MEEKLELENIRKSIFLTSYGSNTGHIASAFSCVEILYALYQKKVLRYDVKNTEWEERDRFVLSKGHGSLALYCILCKAGFFDEKELQSFCKKDSYLGGEPDAMKISGVEASTGSLGHGLSYGLGMALAYKMSGKKNKVYVVVGDGECQEGTIWEAAISAVKFKLDNLIVILDHNKIQKMGTVEDISGVVSWEEKWRSFGWEIRNVNGHNVQEIVTALRNIEENGSPHLIIADTIKGKGVSIMENNSIWHFKQPSKKELKVIMKELQITDEEIEQCKRHI